MARTRLSSKFNTCVKSVRRTVKARKGSNKESAAIAICTKSVLQKRGRTLKRYRKGRLTTQRKLRGGILGFSDSEKMLKKLKDKTNYPNVDDALYKYILTNVERALQDENSKKRYVAAAMKLASSGAGLLAGAIFLVPAMSFDIATQSSLAPELIGSMGYASSEIKATLADYNSHKPKITADAEELLQKLNTITDLEEQLRYSHDQEYKAKTVLTGSEPEVAAPLPPRPTGPSPRQRLATANSEKIAFSPVNTRRG